jgi:hypothetical protein
MPLVLSGTNGVQDNSGAFVAATAQTASGSSVDFTGIPSWVKRITVTMTDVSFAAGGQARIRLGTSGGLVSTGYTTTNTVLQNTPTIGLGSITDGINTIATTAAATVATGQFIIVNVTGNTWQSSGFVSRLADNITLMTTGYIALSGTLDRLSLVATTSTFDAGTINILYE